MLNSTKSQVEHNKLMTEDETPELIILLSQLGLQVDTSITQMLNQNTRLSTKNRGQYDQRKIICFAK